MSSGKLYLESNAQFWRLTVKYEINILKVFSSFVEHNNNNNKIWLFITHSTERNLRFFMHNCAYILKKKLSEQLNLKRIS